jgi:hypothetical protein
VLPSVFGDMLCARLEAMVLSEKLAEDTERATTRVPASWWDHLWTDLRNAVDVLEGPRRRRLALRLIDRLGEPKTKTLELAVTWHRAGLRPHSTIRTTDRLGPVVYVERTDHCERWLS